MNEEKHTINGIPESEYWRLVILMGRTKADNYIFRVNQNYRSVVYKIYLLEIGNWFKSLFGKE
ncbi:hypothetical protein JMN32_18320 [Fulvivirga sp. 29W222]|uniref:Uncharacterized protein n=1 Tax=Fulvivirga marina TaxID=2494733 RepID=A0A937KCL8_9BACT|nr:hypothetical protein [Fulvivirga marina]MBL6448276.1 hypothetical protein [Fulvivirga marina]